MEVKLRELEITTFFPDDREEIHIVGTNKKPLICPYHPQVRVCSIQCAVFEEDIVEDGLKFKTGFYCNHHRPSTFLGLNATKE